MYMGGINKVDNIDSLMIAYESKINIFEEMRYFLMFYQNLGFIQWAFILFILSNVRFMPMGHVFSRTLEKLLKQLFLPDCSTCFSELYICNH